jgi:glyoxylase-like metal-dependent hydrolase (beta-lactamase superfamily II)
MPVAAATLAPAAAATPAATTPPLQPFSTHQPTGPSSPLVHSFFDKSTSTWTYLVVDPASGHAAIIDSVLEYDCASGTVGMESVKGLLAFVQEKGYQIEKIMETHVHADHLTGAHVLKQVSEVLHIQDLPDRCGLHSYPV